MLLIVKILSAIVFLGSIAWFCAAPDYEPAIAIATSLITLIGAFIAEKKRKASQHQSLGKNSLGIQAGGDVHIGTLNTNPKGSTRVE